jgi:hypothetical protein
VALTIDKIKTGKGVAGSRIALIYAPRNAAPGSLEGLTRFLNQQGMRALPGYHGLHKDHVLRISGFTDDSKLLKTLTEDFPRWQREEHDLHRPHEQQIAIAPNVQFESVEDKDFFPHLPPLCRFVKENSNGLTGLSYFAGDVGLLISGMEHGQRKPGTRYNKDWLKMSGSATFMLSSALLLLFGTKADNPRDIYSMLEDTYRPLQDADAAQKRESRHLVDSFVGFIKRHPWEVSSIVNMAGAGALIGSGVRRGMKGNPKAWAETAAATSTLVGVSMPAIIPERGGRSLVDFKDVFEREDGTTIVDSLEKAKEHYPTMAPVINAGFSLGNWIHDSPLKASAPFMAAGNAGFLVSSLLENTGKKLKFGHPKNIDAGLAGAASMYFTGNFMQSISTKGKGPGFDDIVSAAAEFIEHDRTLDKSSRSALLERINTLSKELAEQPEVMHPQGRMARGIAERLMRYDNKSEPKGRKSWLDGFLPGEQQVLKNSPFISPSFVNRVLSPATLGQEQGQQL